MKKTAEQIATSALEKVAASKWTRFLRTAPIEEIKRVLENYNSKSLKIRDKYLVSPFTFNEGAALPQSNRENIIKHFRRAVREAPVAPVTSELPRAQRLERAQRIRATNPETNMVTLHHGTSQEAAENILRGSTPNAFLNHPFVNRGGVLETAGIYGYPASSDSVGKAMRYAKSRASTPGSQPSVLSFDVPETFIQRAGPKNEEVGIPASLWRHARNVRLV
jgi:hypothetical protein